MSLIEARVTGRVGPRVNKKNSYYHSFKTCFEGLPEARPRSRMGVTINLGKHKKKNSYYHSFKTWLEDRPRSCVKRVNPNQHKIKVIIIIVLKLDSGVNSGIDPSHNTGEWTWVDSSQCKDKNCYYHSFKTRFEGSLGLSLGHGPGGSIWVDLSQCMDKSHYYYSFKIQLGSSPEARFKSRVEKVNLANPILKKKIKATLFWPISF